MTLGLFNRSCYNAARTGAAAYMNASLRVNRLLNKVFASAQAPNYYFSSKSFVLVLFASYAQGGIRSRITCDAYGFYTNAVDLIRAFGNYEFCVQLLMIL